MTRQPAAAPLTWNVAGLLGEDPGASREYDIEGVDIPLEEGLTLARPVSGHLRFRRTNRGILVDADLSAALGTECSRCLRPMAIQFTMRFEEEYLPALDMASGKPLPTDEEPEVARLTDHHEIDLEPAVRDEILLAEPIAPVHSPDCPGLCVVCGLPIDEGVHDHETDDIDPRLEALRNFRPEGDDA
jgi:uncharacterized protein